MRTNSMSAPYRLRLSGQTKAPAADRESGDVIDREVVETMLVTLGQKLNLLLRLKLEVELGPRMVGKNAAEVCVEGGLIVDEIREVVNANLATFETEALTKSLDSNG